MKKFNFLLLIFLIFFYGCNSSENTAAHDNKKCPKCNMIISDYKIHSALLEIKNSIHYFDDIGCMVLFAKDNQLDLNQMDSKVFTNDTNRYIDSRTAYYTDDENSPMGYGFSAYENPQHKNIKFDEVIINMLRGEHMANPKIYKTVQ